MKERVIKYKKPIILSLAVLIIFGITMFIDNKNEVKTEKKESFGKAIIEEKTTNKDAEKIYVDIKGAVNKPGVYEINDTFRVIDVVNISGGFTKYADTSVLNLGKRVKDQMVLIIYTKSEIAKFKKNNQIVVSNGDCQTPECVCPDIINDACITTATVSTTTTTSQNTTTVTNKVSINTGSLDQLQTLTGIGLTKAQAIIDYRNENGAFAKIEDLLNVSGIGTATYDKIKENITI